MRSHEVAAANAWVLTTLPAYLVAVMTALLTPLALTAAGVAHRGVAWIVGAVAAASLIAVEPGTLATLLVAPYAALTLLVGLVGVRRLVSRHAPASVALSTGLVFLPASATWLVAERCGYALLDYPPFWVLLTAAHFHVAGAYLLIVLGRITDQRGVLAQAVALACVLSVPLTAAGIYGPAWLEVIAAVGMATSAFAAGVLLVARGPWLSRCAGGVLLLSMPLAAAFALRDHGTTFTILGLDPLGSMLVSHGVLNVLVFALLALLSLARTPPRPQLVSPPPVSLLAGGLTIGAQFLARRELERDVTPAPSGLVDDIADLAHPGLDVARVSPAIRAFYERTGEHEMIVRPRWRFGFRTGARVWAAIARRIGQLQLPVNALDGKQALTSRIVAVEPQADGRVAPRSWIRTFPDGRALYVAVYSTHEADGRRYMNIAFPLPGGNLSSLLRMDTLGEGVRVSTRFGGDCGVYLVARGIPLRTPMHEWIDVWDIADPAVPAALRTWAAGYTTVARHTLTLFGVRFLELDYAMRIS